MTTYNEAENVRILLQNEKNRLIREEEDKQNEYERIQKEVVEKRERKKRIREKKMTTMSKEQKILYMQQFEDEDEEFDNI